MKRWNRVNVFDWIQQRKPHLLQGSDLKYFKRAKLSGEAFLLAPSEGVNSPLMPV